MKNFLRIKFKTILSEVILVFLCFQSNQAESMMEVMSSSMSSVSRDLAIMRSMFVEVTNRDNCESMMRNGINNNGIYFIHPNGRIMSVYCVFNHSDTGKNWLVFQRRTSGEVDFYRSWQDYKKGFGDLQTEFWLGLENLHIITSNDNYSLRVEMENFKNEKAWAEYGTFYIGNETSKYELLINNFSGNAGDSLSYHNNMPFSTYDNDNDRWTENCAEARHGAWWYNRCCYANLNGEYYHKITEKFTSILWFKWKRIVESLRAVTMMIRPKI